MILYQDKNGYFYNSDSIYLYDFARRFIRSGLVLDVGCGCGIVGLLLKNSSPHIDLYQLDTQKIMAKLSKINSKVNRLDSKILLGDFLEFDFLDLRFDFLVSNPPFYKATTKRSENRVVEGARYEDALDISLAIERASKLLKPKGEFIFCYRVEGLSKILRALSKNRVEPTHIKYLHPKDNKSASIFFCRAKKSTKEELKVEVPYINFINNALSIEAQRIYKDSNTYSIKCEIC